MKLKKLSILPSLFLYFSPYINAMNSMSKLQDNLPPVHPEAIAYKMHCINPTEEEVIDHVTNVFGRNRIEYKKTQLIKTDSKIDHAAISADGKVIATSSGRTIKLLNTSGKYYKGFREHTDKITALAFAPQGSLIASGSKDNSIKLWDPNQENSIATLTGHKAPITTLTISPDSKTLFSAAEDKTLCIWNISTKKMILTFPLKNNVNNIAPTNQNKYIITQEESCKSTLWDLSSEVPSASTITENNVEKLIAPEYPYYKVGRYKNTNFFIKRLDDSIIQFEDTRVIIKPSDNGIIQTLLYENGMSYIRFSSNCSHFIEAMHDQIAFFAFQETPFSFSSLSTDHYNALFKILIYPFLEKYELSCNERQHIKELPKTIRTIMIESKLFKYFER